MFREARRDDFEAVLRLYQQLNPTDPVLQDGSDISVFEKLLTNPGLKLLVIENDGALVATAYLNIIPNLTRSASPYAVIENVVVDESHRRQGFGRSLMQWTIQVAWDAGCYKAMLMTGSREPATHDFYKACGFSSSDKTAYVARP